MQQSRLLRPFFTLYLVVGSSPARSTNKPPGGKPGAYLYERGGPVLPL